MPLVIVLHGNTRTGEHVRWLTKFDELAARERFVVAYPDGINHGWNDGRPPLDHGVDDVAFLLGLIDEVAAKHAIDRSRVYVTGISNGGIMALRLACEHADKLAAVAAVAANIPAAIRCEPRVPVSALLINGTADQQLPYSGGIVGGRGRNRGSVLGTAMTIDVFARAAHCQQPVQTVEEPDPNTDDGTRTRRTTYVCPDDIEVELLAIDGGGHTWPGGPQYAPIEIVGRVSHDFDATARIWAFFAAHSRAAPP